MTEVNNFNFKQFDIGGSGGAIANDGKLTGEEVDNAKKAGWTVWDEFREGDKAEFVKNENSATKLLKTIQNLFHSETYMKYCNLRDKLLEEKLAKFGIYPSKFNGANIYNIDVMLFDERYKQAKEEAEKEAKEQLGLNPNAFSLNLKWKKVGESEILPEKKTPKVKDQAKVDEDFNKINFNITDPKEAKAKEIVEQLKAALQNPSDILAKGRVLDLLQMAPEYTSLVLKYMPDLIQQLAGNTFGGRGLTAQDMVKFFGLNLLERYNQAFPNQTDYTKEYLESITDVNELAKVLKTMADEVNKEDYYTKANEQIELANKTIAEAANMEPKLEIEEGVRNGSKYKRAELPDGRVITAIFDKYTGELSNIQVSTIPGETELRGEKGEWHEVLYTKDFVRPTSKGRDLIQYSDNYDFNAIKQLCERIFGKL